MLIRILVYTLVPFFSPEVLDAVREEYSRVECEEWTDKNRFYALFVAKTSSIFDLKTRLDEEFGFPFEQTEVYFENRMLDQTAYLTKIPNADVSHDSILSVICTGKPRQPVYQTLRDTLNEVKVADVRFFNTG